jgi:hypothetical protein
MGVQLSGCEKEIKPDSVGYKPKLVLNALMRAGYPLCFYITASTDMNSILKKEVATSSIQIFCNGSEIYPEIIRNGWFYQTNYTVQSGCTIGIQVIANNYEPVFAEDRVPFASDFKTLSHSEKIGISADGDYFSDFWFNTTDDSSAENYYEIRGVTRELNGKTYQTHIWGSNDVAFATENSTKYSYGNQLFNDNTFNGENKELRCFYWYSESPEVIIMYRTVSKTYYNYKNSMAQHRDYLSQDDLWTGLGTPLEIYSNVNGGLGIVAAYAQVSDTIKTDSLK